MGFLESIHNKVKVPFYVLFGLTVAAAVVAGISDDVSWKIPATAGITAAIQFITGYQTPEKAGD